MGKYGCAKCRKIFGEDEHYHKITIGIFDYFLCNNCYKKLREWLEIDEEKGK